MSRSAEKKQNFMHGAAILTVGVIIMKILGAIYKVPLGNILGDYGYGIFLSTYNVYNIFFTLSTAGLPVALSRMIAVADAQGKVATKEKTFRAALLTFAVIGLLFGMIMFFGNEWLSRISICVSPTRRSACVPWPRPFSWCAWFRLTGATARATAT